MALEAVPLLRENSILCWDKESVFKTAPGTSPWNLLGRVEEWADLGPIKPLQGDPPAGAGREPGAYLQVLGTQYPDTTIGPFQVVDPRFLGFVWGQEVSAPAALGSGYYRHTVTPTTNGALPSMSIQMADYKAGVLTDGLTYLGVIMPRLSLRGEEGAEDGTGGRVMAAPTFRAHDDSSAVAAKPATALTQEPYDRSHAAIQFFNGDVDWRIHSWEINPDNNAKVNYYHRSTDAGKPAESPPENFKVTGKFDIIADGHANSVSGKLIRDLVRDEVLGAAVIKYVRSASQDEWAVNLSNVRIMSGLKQRRRGKIHYEVEFEAGTSNLQYVDQNSSRYFPA